MLIRNWESVGITPADFERLWNLPYGEYHNRIKKLLKSKNKETFFPQIKLSVTCIEERTVTITTKKRTRSQK